MGKVPLHSTVEHDSQEALFRTILDNSMAVTSGCGDGYHIGETGNYSRQFLINSLLNLNEGKRLDGRGRSHLMTVISL